MPIVRRSRARCLCHPVCVDTADLLEPPPTSDDDRDQSLPRLGRDQCNPQSTCFPSRGFDFEVDPANRIAGRADALIPCAWVNACASVIAAIIATVPAIHLGFGAVMVPAVALYVLAAAAWPALGRG
jgi:hypothetical protein